MVISRAEYQRVWRKANPQKVRANYLRWKEENPEKMRVCKKRSRRQQRLRQYSLDAVKYQALVARQQGRCAICLEPLRGHGNIDHDHATGVVRGVLCRSCNLGLGFFRDNPELLVSASRYVLPASLTLTSA